VLKSIDDSRLRVHIIWTPNLRSDSQLESVYTSKEFNDPRLRYYWDEEFVTGKAWGETIGIGGAAWDVYFLYGADREWAGETPADPDYYMHQLGGLPRELLLNPEQLVEETKKLLDKI